MFQNPDAFDVYRRTEPLPFLLGNTTTASADIYLRAELLQALLFTSVTGTGNTTPRPPLGQGATW